MALKPDMLRRQKVLVLYLQTSALDSGVVGWARYDGTGATIFCSKETKAQQEAVSIYAGRG